MECMLHWVWVLLLQKLRSESLKVCKRSSIKSWGKHWKYHSKDRKLQYYLKPLVSPTPNVWNKCIRTCTFVYVSYAFTLHTEFSHKCNLYRYSAFQFYPQSLSLCKQSIVFHLLFVYICKPNNIFVNSFFAWTTFLIWSLSLLSEIFSTILTTIVCVSVQPWFTFTSDSDAFVP